MPTTPQTEIACELYEICGQTIYVEDSELWYFEDGWYCPECDDAMSDYGYGFPMSLEYDEG